MLHKIREEAYKIGFIHENALQFSHRAVQISYFLNQSLQKLNTVPAKELRVTIQFN